MTSPSPCQKLTIVVGGSHQWKHRPLYVEIVHRAHAAGLAGASVFRGIEGYGANNHLHAVKFLQISQDLPTMIVIVDTAERIGNFLTVLGEVIDTGLVTVEDITGGHLSTRESIARA